MRRGLPKGLPGAAAVLALLEGPAKEVAIRLACRGFCEYDKGEGGEGGCAGFAAVRDALEGGRIGKDALLPLAGKAPGAARRVPFLVDRLCSPCSYRHGDCDFMSDTPVPGATPCGGYRLLMALLDLGLIVTDDLSYT